jgi:hypothetical protein
MERSSRDEGARSCIVVLRQPVERVVRDKSGEALETRAF